MPVNAVVFSQAVAIAGKAGKIGRGVALLRDMQSLQLKVF